MDPIEKQKILELYPEYDSIYGPYINTQNGRARIAFRKGREKQTIKLLSRVRMEAHIGRRLSESESVDHKDEDSTNDDINNLQIMSGSDNAKKWHRAHGKYVRKDHDQICGICKEPFRSTKPRLLCFSPVCKTILRRMIAIRLGSRPPQNHVIAQAVIEEIQHRVKLGETDYRIAKDLKIDDKTVKRYRNMELSGREP